ncbi:olfactory receptor 1468-like [Discoglossus pictus]
MESSNPESYHPHKMDRQNPQKTQKQTHKNKQTQRQALGKTYWALESSRMDPNSSSASHINPGVMAAQIVNKTKLYDRTISFIGCFVQMFFFIGLGSSECVLLAAMAYDRYIAICQPLFYSTHMNPSFCVFLVVLACVIGFLNSLVHTVFTASLPFCSDHKIDHFFCDIPPLLKLSCTNSQINELVALFVGGCVIVGSLILTLISYACILRAVLGMSSLSGRHKTFSTCGSHLTVVTFYFGTFFVPNTPKSGRVSMPSEGMCLRDDKISN